MDSRYILPLGVFLELKRSILRVKESKNYWIKNNAQWVFSGIGVCFISIIIGTASNTYTEKTNSNDIVTSKGIVSYNTYLKTDAQEKSYAQQMQELEYMGKSISDLNNFIKLQKKKLKNSENILKSLKKEHDTLKPIVDTEREVIEKIFAVQSQKAMDRIWKERVVSFFLGILASLFASFIYGLFQRFYKNNKTR
ncbi:MAG: hypothetical protein D3908_11040 [Candidatus Electrothrix sp. AUS4]|nr:hypothetical protein [Candidatus Electrothrix sp. AUS4]